jgi:hypothetical protein
MELDGPFPAPELGPGKDAGTEINDSGIQDFDLRALGLGGQPGGKPRD